MTTIYCLTAAKARPSSNIRRLAMLVGKTFSLALCAWFLGTLTVVQAQNCTPNANQVALFQLINYGGQCVLKGVGDYANAAAIGLPDNSISSIKIGSRVWAALCANTNMRGTCNIFRENDPNLGDDGIGNNAASSVQVKELCPPGPNQVALFNLPNYTGACVVANIGEDRYGAFGLSQDTASSIKVGSNVKALLCRDRLFEGRCETFTSDDPNLADNAVGDNTVSSVLIYRSCTPGGDQVALYRNRDHRGPCVVREIGQYRNNYELGLANESISSIEVGPNVGIMACENGGLAGRCTSVNGNGRTVSNFTTNHSISSIWIYRQCHPDDDEIGLYMDRNYVGPCVVKRVGRYSTAESMGLADNSVSSIKVGANVKAQLCSLERFEGNCSSFIYGHSVSSLSDLKVGDETASSAEVRRKDDQPFCIPRNDEVALFETENFNGDCETEQIGRFPDGDPYMAPPVSSIKVGSDVQARLCTERNFGGLCDTFTSERRSFNNYSIFRHTVLSFIVERRGSSNSGPASSDNNEQSRTVVLAAHVPYRGFPWWTGRFPTIGTLNGNLSRVANPRNSVWLGFLKPGRYAEDCGNRDAFVLLRPGETMSPDQMRTAFGSENPALPVPFLACSGDVADVGARGELIFHALNLNITYTVRR